MELDYIRFEGGTYKLEDWELYKVTGKDALKFLQGQTTNDLNNLKDNESVLTCRLKRTGQVVSFFYVAKKSEFYLLLIPRALRETTLNDLLKFVIMEDVEFFPLAQDSTLIISPIWNQASSLFNFEEMFNLKFFGEDGIVIWGENSQKKLSFLPINEKDFKTLQILSGYPAYQEIIAQDKLVNEFYLNEIAVSYKKGCFLGQETVAKVENFRGPSYYPVLLKVNSSKMDNFESLISGEFELEGRKAGKFLGTCIFEGITFIKASLFRDFRIENKILDFGDFKASVIYFPFFKNNSPREKADYIYHLAVDFFKKNQESKAIDLFERSIAIDNSYPDPYESLGVLLGRQGNYEEAITWMDKLLEVDSESIMAHTNKSLYLMKLGRIEEAEKEKEKATVKNFELLGKAAKSKKEIEEKKLKEEAEIKRREGMFKQVLELDSEDTIANFGMADILFKKGKYIEATAYLEKILKNNPKYSNAYLLMGKTMESLGDIAKAKEIYEMGVVVASKNGDMMPANEMQSRLSKLT